MLYNVGYYIKSLFKRTVNCRVLFLFVVVFLAWIKYISPYYYGFQSLAIIQFRNLPLYCTSQQLLPNGVCPITNGNQVILVLFLLKEWIGVMRSYLAVIKISFQFESIFNLSRISRTSEGGRQNALKIATTTEYCHWVGYSVGFAHASIF